MDWFNTQSYLKFQTKMKSILANFSISIRHVWQPLTNVVETNSKKRKRHIFKFCLIFDHLKMVEPASQIATKKYQMQPSGLANGPKKIGSYTFYIKSLYVKKIARFFCGFVEKTWGRKIDWRFKQHIHFSCADQVAAGVSQASNV